MEIMCKLNFPLEVGALLRGAARKALYDMKHKIEWEIDGANVSIDEVKNFLDSTFYIKIDNVNETDARRIKVSIENWVNKVKRG